ncbi:hypothetical protein VNI00_014558 [Paramarasmius palmivorus]|uniref:Uncharacterized protein n=1 Tax=Paramarasmius palmivorus TaxID=297713 RepID=A0AAW0BTQ7_9AGAR
MEQLTARMGALLQWVDHVEQNIHYETHLSTYPHSGGDDQFVPAKEYNYSTSSPHDEEKDNCFTLMDETSQMTNATRISHNINSQSGNFTYSDQSHGYVKNVRPTTYCDDTTSTEDVIEREHTQLTTTQAYDSETEAEPQLSDLDDTNADDSERKADGYLPSHGSHPHGAFDESSRAIVIQYDNDHHQVGEFGYDNFPMVVEQQHDGCMHDTKLPKDVNR